MYRCCQHFKNEAKNLVPAGGVQKQVKCKETGQIFRSDSYAINRSCNKMQKKKDEIEN